MGTWERLSFVLSQLSVVRRKPCHAVEAKTGACATLEQLNGQETTDEGQGTAFLVLTHLQYRSKMVGAARGNPRLQVLAKHAPRRRIRHFGFNFHEMPPIAYGALNGHLGTMFHSLIQSLKSKVRSR